MECALTLGDGVITSLQLLFKKSSDSTFTVKIINTDCSDAVLFGLDSDSEFKVRLNLFTDLTPAGVESVEYSFKTSKGIF